MLVNRCVYLVLVHFVMPHTEAQRLALHVALASAESSNPQYVFPIPISNFVVGSQLLSIHPVIVRQDIICDKYRTFCAFKAITLLTRDEFSAV